ncbi:hypothetical protein J4409_01275 [Candidatus Woesearchaeota archaeon]|nr:hypothetical protein [Candidatus Woesearchaeota archaeon]
MNEAQDLIQKYSIKLLPTLILSEDIFEYQQASKILEKLGTKESDGSYVLRSLAPPYYKLLTFQARLAKTWLRSMALKQLQQ